LNSRDTELPLNPVAPELDAGLAEGVTTAFTAVEE
jgi:hypothetical protein